MPQMSRLVLRALRNDLMYFVVSLNVGFLADGSSAWSSMSATTIVQFGQTLAAMSVNFAAAFGSREVGCVKWLASFHGAITCTVGKVAKNERSAASYALAVGSLQIDDLKFFLRLHFDASPRVCSN